MTPDSPLVAPPLALEVVDLAAVAVLALVVRQDGLAELVGPDVGRVLAAPHVEALTLLVANLEVVISGGNSVVS